MPNLTKASKDETVSRTSSASGKKVASHFGTKPSSESSEVFIFDTTFDFTKCSDAEILLLAAKSVRIDVQRMFRDMYKADRKKALDAATWSAVDVKSTIVDAARKAADPNAKARNAIAKATEGMTAAQRKKFIEELTS